MSETVIAQWAWFIGIVLAIFVIRRVWRNSVEAAARERTRERDAVFARDRKRWMNRLAASPHLPSGAETPRPSPEEFWRETLNRNPREGRPTVNVAELARRLGVEADYLRRFVPEYREVRVPKRRGGTRVLHVPDDPTKKLQRKINRRLLSALEPHPAALGFRRGRSVADHAAKHSGCDLILKCDVVDFFGSTLGTRVNAFFRRLGWDDEAASLLTRFTCRENGLPQGAPTSPILSNLVNRGLDAKLAGMAQRIGMAYSRYADDLCFSYQAERKTSARRARGMLQFARGTCRAYGYRLHGRDKTRFVRRHRRQLVCGLVVNDRPNLPRETRRRLRAARHRQATGRPATLTPEQLAGWGAYESMVETPRPAE